MRYVIKGPKGAYFTQFEPVKTVEVTLNGVVVGTETHVLPTFEAFKPSQAIHFATEQDALAQIANDPKSFPVHGGPKAFAGCSVEPTDG